MNLTVNCNTIDKPLVFNQIQFNNALLSLKRGVEVRPWPVGVGLKEFCMKSFFIQSANNKRDRIIPDGIAVPLLR